jgi:hypothetical protein
LFNNIICVLRFCFPNTTRNTHFLFLLLAVQCCANDESEYKSYRKVHAKLHGMETCTVAYHVGCARWGLDDGGEYECVQRVLFDPVNVNGVVSNVFCTLHAKDLQTYNINGTKVSDLRYPKDKMALPVTINEAETHTGTRHQQAQHNFKKQKSNSSHSNDRVNSNKNNSNDWKRMSEPKRTVIEKQQREMMFDELKKKLHHADEEILNKGKDFQNRVKSIFSFYKENLIEKHSWDEGMVVKYFNLALNDVIRQHRNIQIDTYYNVLDFIPARRKASATVNVTTTTKAVAVAISSEMLHRRNIPSMARENLESQMYLKTHRYHGCIRKGRTTWSNIKTIRKRTLHI